MDFVQEFGNASVKLINKELELNKNISENSIVPKALDLLKLLVECLTPLFLDFLDEFTSLVQVKCRLQPLSALTEIEVLRAGVPQSSYG